MKTGWLVNDCLTVIPGTTTFWHNLLSWFPELQDKTGGYTNFNNLAKKIENELRIQKPYYIIRNGSYFRRIYTDVKIISLIQDVLKNNTMQIDVIRHSDIIVFNTHYVYEKYKNYIKNEQTVKICPLGVDFDFFKPISEKHPDVLPNSILFIGSSLNYPKGFNIVLDIIQKMKGQNFCLVMKDDFSIIQIPNESRDNVRIFNKVNHDTLRLIINSCVCAICPSYEETQHLAGIECGACDIPIIARAVGVYYDNKEFQEWGLIADDTNFSQKIVYVLSNRNKFSPRLFFINKYSLEVCKQNWIDIVDSI